MSLKLCNGVQVVPFANQLKQWHWGCKDCQRHQPHASNPKPPALRWTDHCADRLPFGTAEAGDA